MRVDRILFWALIKAPNERLRAIYWIAVILPGIGARTCLRGRVNRPNQSRPCLSNHVCMCMERAQKSAQRLERPTVHCPVSGIWSGSRYGTRKPCRKTLLPVVTCNATGAYAQECLSHALPTVYWIP
ncbi:hypothetical protein ASPWEDRAFT_683465 [Aspergillus wentii DTO 134E9]|uniref:Uncharacterized protein n=1 Tax=Aspergillus wentii DTO 134E9 TaxID=1073089 RepID=A0A1L9R894_ASPWE|nr:uncharacterized protein ASPWEDRAFT_683465 [Aspergillus wentii DTO 134E9]OJJ31140.1 hypothetical protein ASPWEDRAFT_683465 [Aspergillus wentii DTO 134E9]